MNAAGSCQCGQVKYEVDGETLGLVVCYCSECRRMSTGFATCSLIVPRSSFRLIAGSLNQFTRCADSGNENVANFCPECGVRVFHETPAIPGIVRVKAGTLESAGELEPDAHVWTSSAPAWVQIPEGALAYEQQPSAEAFVQAVAARRAGR
ncbi:MAG: GFA family protein [Gammaproteobacteria bacterium]|nr:GFA family protein [Gammaproteobacteria bacterium]NNL99276.1 GFA family protein [Gammaproteobacteria bacterium]